MRKKTIKCLFDNVLWYMVYMLPLLLLLIYWFKTGDISLSNAMSSAGLGILSNNPIYVGLDGIFGSTGTMPLFSSPDILLYGSWFISTFLVHLFVDFLLFIPRLAHKWMNWLGGDSDGK